MMLEGKRIFAFLSPRRDMAHGQKRKVDDDHDEELHSGDQHSHKLPKAHSHDLDLSADVYTSIDPAMDISQFPSPSRGSTESRTISGAIQDNTPAMDQALRQIIELHSSEVKDYRERIRVLEEGQQARDRPDLASGFPHPSDVDAELKRENERLASELLRAEQALKKHTGVYEPTVTAGDITKQLDKLATKIHLLVELKFNGLPLGVPIRKEHEKLFRKMSGDFKEFLKDAGRKASFIEAAIWHKLIDDILSNPAKVFNEKMSVAMSEMQERALGAGFHTLCTKDEIETRDLDFTTIDDGVLRGYHNWRTQTGRLLDNTLYNDGAFYKTGSKNNSYNKLLDDLVGFFGRFCSTPKNLDDLQAFLGSIIRQAAALARLLIRCQDFHVIRMPTDYFFVKMPEGISLKDLRIEDFDLEYMENMDVENMSEEAMQKEDWIMKPECYGFRLNEGLMDAVSESEQDNDPDVKLVISPLLLRYTEEGAGWKEATILTKAKVLV